MKCKENSFGEVTELSDLPHADNYVLNSTHNMFMENFFISMWRHPMSKKIPNR